MSKRFFAAILALSVVLSLSACSVGKDEENEHKEKLTVYYVNKAGYENGGNYIEPVEYNIDERDDLVHKALDYLGTAPAEGDFATSLVKGTRIYSYSLEGGEMEIDLSPAYLLLNELEKSIVKCCLTLTLCGIDEVDTVSIYVDGKLVEEKLDARFMIIKDTDTNEYEKRITLYFPENNYYYLQTEYRVLTVGQDKLLAEYVVDELIKSTQTEGITGSMPEGTKLLSVEQKNGICTVDLSREFVDNRPLTASRQRMTVYSIVNSLVNLENIEKVSFLVEGARSEGYEYIDISGNFTEFEDIIYDPQEASKIFATIYLGLGDTGKMVRTPVIIDRESEMTVEENIVQYILTLAQVGGYESLIPSLVTLNSIENVNGVCTIDLSGALLAGGTGKNATLAACAIAASVIDSGAAASVTVNVDGKRFMENITQYTDLIIE